MPSGRGDILLGVRSLSYLVEDARRVEEARRYVKTYLAMILRLNSPMPTRHSDILPGRTGRGRTLVCQVADRGCVRERVRRWVGRSVGAMGGWGVGSVWGRWKGDGVGMCGWMGLGGVSELELYMDGEVGRAGFVRIVHR